MGLFDIFKFGKVLVHTAQTVRRQRVTAREVRSLPMHEMIPRCLEGMHSPHASWKAAARSPRADAAEIAFAKRLPAELAAFYACCDGFDCSDDFPARVLALADLKPGADHVPPPSQLVLDAWREHGNDSDRPGMLAVLPPDDLAALMANAAESFIAPAALDAMVPLVPLEENAFTLIMLAPAGDKLPAGGVIECENGAATRYDGFGHWLATRGTLLDFLR